MFVYKWMQLSGVKKKRVRFTVYGGKEEHVSFIQNEHPGKHVALTKFLCLKILFFVLNIIKFL